jgi:hypothetical protein
MKKFAKPAILLAATLGSCSLAATTYANQLTLQTSRPMTIVYQDAHQNRGGQVVLGATHSIITGKSQVINIDPADFDLSGMVFLSVDGHKIPDADHAFNKQDCALTTDKTHPNGTVTFAGKHPMTYSVNGGIFG